MAYIDCYRVPTSLLENITHQFVWKPHYSWNPRS